MCDKNPGVRCSDYATSTLKITKKRLAKIETELAAYEEKYAASLAAENPTPRDVIRQNKHKRLLESKEAHQKIVDGAEFEYYSCPVGQAELKADLQKAIEDGDIPLKEELEARIAAGVEYRAAARQNLRELEEIEKNEGPEAALEKNWEMYEEAVETETEATILIEKSQAELDAARAEAAEYERAMEEYRANDRIDTPEEELEKARKRKMQLIIIGAISASILVYSLTRQASTGQKSQLLQYGKSMAMRQVMTGGRQFIMPLLKGDSREEDAREVRAEKEAEQRAAEARDRVLKKYEQEEALANKKAEQQTAHEERKKIRDEERAAELAHHNALREGERASERQRRAEELAHYEELVNKFKDLPLTPEMQALIDSKKPVQRPARPARPSNNGESRQFSTRRRDAAGKAAQPQNPAHPPRPNREPQAAQTSQPAQATQPELVSQS